MITVVLAPDRLHQEEVELEGYKFRHLFRVRRLARGEEIRLVDGRGTARSSRVVEVSRYRARLAVGPSAPTNEPATVLELLTAVPKPARLSWLIEKVTEVGVRRVRLIQTERAPRRVQAATIDRLHRIAIAAVEQSQRAVVPEITGVHRWSEIGELLAASEARWVLDPTSPQRLVGTNRVRAGLVVGPEGGFTAIELEELASWGCRSATLGPTVLRVETAAVVGCASLLSVWESR